MTFSIRSYRPEDLAAVVALWHDAGLARPWNDPARDIARKREIQPELFFVGESDGAIVASAMAGDDGHRAWVYYVAVGTRARGNGYGRALMQHVEATLRARGCAKLNLQVRADNHAAVGFYERLGYLREERIDFGKRLDQAPAAPR
jgi:ribosomal protein S18 acetylase RimI-like enzyme